MMKPEITNMCFVILHILTVLTVLEVKVKMLLPEDEHQDALLKVRETVHILALHAKCAKCSRDGKLHRFRYVK